MEGAHLIDRAGNWAVVQLEGRRFPGIFMQGDTFASLVRLIEGADDPLPDDLQELRSEMIAVRRYFEGVLKDRGEELPY